MMTQDTDPFDIKTDELKLMAGEMTAGELRTVRAVLGGLKARWERRASTNREPAPDTIEIRLNEDGTLDEVVAPRLHLEQMSPNHWWMAIYDGDPRTAGRVTVNFGAKGKISTRVERESWPNVSGKEDATPAVRGWLTGDLLARLFAKHKGDMTLPYGVSAGVWWDCYADEINEALDQKVSGAPVAAALREALHWLDSNTTFYNTDESPGGPVLASVSKRIWYHATDDTESYPFSEVIRRALAGETP